MGREWYYWGGKSTKRVRGSYEVEGDTSAATTSGCMSAVFQLFDLHHFHLGILPHYHQSSDLLPQQPPIIKGLQAPRNSLESEDAFMDCANPLSATETNKENLNIPMGIIQIRTCPRGQDSATTTPRESTSNTKVLSENTSCSPGPKTPLVARLMGLDTTISPATPSSTSSSHRIHPRRRSCSDNITSGTRSLPETPRVSSERRSDVDRHHHRLSLQIYKENNIDHENMSPRNYARQILKQVKERVSRRVGMDITNTASNREERRDENLLGSKSKKSQRATTNPKGDQVGSKKSSFHPSKSPLEVKLSLEPKEDKKCKIVMREKFGNSMKIKKEEPFVRASLLAARVNNSEKKCKKTPLSNELPSFLTVKKDPSPPATKLPQKQALSDILVSKLSLRLSRGSSPGYKQEATHRHVNLENTCIKNTSVTSKTLYGSNEVGLFQYIAEVLRRTGITKDAPVSFSRWFSPSHPLDPSIFHHLDLSFSAPAIGQLNLRCNQKLIFHLVDEILVQILKPYIKVKPWLSPYTMYHDHQMQGGQLIDQLCAKIISSPLANCQTLQDIDALIDRDLQMESPSKSQTVVAYEEEGEAIVLYLERHILDSLVHETATFFMVVDLWTD